MQKISSYSKENNLTGKSLTIQVKLAAGFECFEVQLALKLSPTR